MNIQLASKKTKIGVKFGIFTGIMVLLCSVLFTTGPAQAAACQVPSTNYGSATATISVPTATTYRIWSRMMAPNATNNSYLLEVDGQQCYVVGGNLLPTNSWTWVANKDGNPASKIDLALSAGNHTVTFIGNKPDVKLDRLVLAADLNCVPTGNGNNCDTPNDTVSPTVDLTAPAENSILSGATELRANATDNTSVTKVEFYANSTLLGTDTSAPYAYSWNTTSVSNGQKTITAKAYDTSGNFGSDSYRVTVQNGDAQAPTVPTGVAVRATSPTTIDVTWAASTDNVAVTGYLISRNGSPLTQVGTALTFTDTALAPNTQYTYAVSALDAAGNKSAASSAASVKTPALPDTIPPTTPTNLTAKTLSTTQINLTWTASTDNSGRVNYDIYQVLGGGSTEKIGSSTSTSYGVTGLLADTDYTFMIKARDSAGNESQASDNANAKTAADQSAARSIIWGVVRDGNGRRLKNVTVEAVSTIDSKKYVYKTGARGTYIFSKLPAGRYNLSFKAEGYKTKNGSAVVNGKNTKQRDITLQRRNNR